MLFSWRKNTEPKESAKGAELGAFKQSDLAVRLSDVTLGSQIRNLSYEIKKGTWILLMGPDSLTKALFCDLCFGFVKPERGHVEPRFSGADVSFLGRPNSTYGTSLLDHLTSGVRQRSRESLENVAKNVFGPTLLKLTAPNTILRTICDAPVKDLALIERDYLEIAEANAILQNRAAVIIDTSSDFYQKALEQGFRHSQLFLKSGKTIFWLMSDEFSTDQTLAPWSYKHAVPQLSLYFSSEALLKNIN